MHSLPRQQEKMESKEEKNENETDSTSKSKSKTYSLDSNKVCVFIGKQILIRSGKDGKMNKQEFIMEWQNTVPDNLRANCKLEILTGHALIGNDSRNEAFVELFEETELSSDPKKRFEELFKKKREWKMEEIEPYLKSLGKGGIKVDKLLLKNARTVRKRDKDNKEYRVFAARNYRQ